MGASMQTIRSAVAAVLTCTCATGAWAQQAQYGVQGFYGAQASSGDQLVNSPNGNINTPITGEFPFAASTSATTGAASASLAISATPQNGNIGLHGFADAALNGAQYEQAGAFDQFDLYAFDTFYIGGPAGSFEDFQYSLTLDGTTSTTMTLGNADATRAYGALELFSDANWVEAGVVAPFSSCHENFYGNYYESNGNPCGMLAYLDPQGDQTLTGIITLAAGSAVQLGEMLSARAYVSQETTGSAIFDASNTGFFTLTPITPGASFTTASGLTYAEFPDMPSGVPEPSTWALMLLGLATIGVAMRRKRVLRASRQNSNSSKMTQTQTKESGNDDRCLRRAGQSAPGRGEWQLSWHPTASRLFRHISKLYADTAYVR
jgi:hypothetical protein